jgi:hypothetical protein
MELWNVKVFAGGLRPPLRSSLRFERPLEWEIDGVWNVRTAGSLPAAPTWSQVLKRLWGGKLMEMWNVQDLCRPSGRPQTGLRFETALGWKIDGAMEISEIFAGGLQAPTQRSRVAKRLWSGKLMELWMSEIFAGGLPPLRWAISGFETPLEWEIDGDVNVRDFRGRSSDRPYMFNLPF